MSMPLHSLRLRVFFLEIITSFLCLSAFSSPLKIEHFSNLEGFNQNTVNTIESDQQGFLWIGTPNSLIKYDGYKFTRFTSDPSSGACVAHNYINCLLTDKNGLLWIGTRAGLNVYIPWLEKFIPVPLGQREIIHLGQGADERIWVSGDRQLYCCEAKLVDGSVKIEVSHDLLQGKFQERGDILEFCFSCDSSILLSTSSSLMQIDLRIGKSCASTKVLSVSNKEPFAGVPVFAVYKEDVIYWVAAANGLHKTVLEGDKIHILKSYNNIGSAVDQESLFKVLSIYGDHEGRIWIATLNHGLSMYLSEKDEFVNYPYDSKNEFGITSSRVNCLFQDRFNVLWIGTAQGGLNKLDLQQKNFNNYSNNPYESTSLSGDLITSVLEDSKGYLWVSSYNKTLNKSRKRVADYEGGSLDFDLVSKILCLSADEIVLKIYEDKKGFIWFGTTHSLIGYNPLTHQCSKLDLPNSHPDEASIWRVIEQIDETKMLFGGHDLVVVENPWLKIGREPVIKIEALAFMDMEGFLCQSIVNDADSLFWCGTTGGLFKCILEGGKIIIDKVFTTQTGDDLHLSINNVFSLYKDANNCIWVGTFGGGLNKIICDDHNRVLAVERYRKGGVLHDDVIYGIIQEDEQHLWLSTDMGLCRLNIKSESSEVFDVYDGLPNNNFRQCAYFKGESGNFYFGGLNGLTMFKPENIKLNKELPDVVITSLAINNRKVTTGEEINGRVLLSRAIIETDKISLNYTDQIVTLNLTVQHSVSPFKNKLAYKLEGFDKEWIEVSQGKKSVTYMNLPAGDYVFKVKGANGDGLWNTKATELAITVWPPWYKTWWFYVLVLVVIALLIYAVSSYVIQMVKLRHELEYEQIDKQRMDAVTKSKLLFFTNISHEFRTPLTLISGPLEQLIAMNDDRKKERYFTIIQNNIKRLLKLVDQLITFRRAEQGHMELEYTKCTLGEFICPVNDAFEDFALSKNVNFVYKVASPSSEEVVLDINKMERILFNLLSNAFKFTPEDGSISIYAEVISEGDSRRLIVKVIDDGKGIPEDKIEMVFDRFYQLEGRRENIGGTGIGLSLCKTLVDIMGGEITVESDPNVRTCFKVSVPCDRIEKVKENSRASLSSIKDWVPVHVSSIEDEEVFDTGIPPSKLRLIIVEDEPEVRGFLYDALSEKYLVTLAENGIEGYEKIQEKVPSLIISDVMMPKMDGFELCKKVKTDPSLCHVPVILLTALGDNDNEIKGLEFGADDYISKPFSLKHLQLKVEKLIENNIRIKNYFSQNSVLPDASIDMSKRDKDFLTSVISSIEENFSDSHFGVEELSKEIGLSASQFYRKLKQLTGQIPNAYLRNFRLQRAAKMMRENLGKGVGEIMYDVGFESSSSFSAAFKKLFGCAPSDYQKKHTV